MKSIKNKILTFSAAALALSMTTSCIEEINPQTSTATSAQVANAPGAFDNYVTAITNSLCGQFTYAGNSSTRAYDFGLPAFYLIRDIMGQDVVYAYQNWFSSWYSCKYLGPSYAYAQLPWTYYYGWIKSCNTVISLCPSEVADVPEEKRSGAGIAYAMRAYFYMDLARMFAQESYGKNKNAETVPIVTDQTSVADLSHNARATNEKMWQFIISDLDKAEALLEGYTRGDVYTPDQSVAYGLKARAYLEMEDWANAEKYAKLAQKGYTVMTANEYTDHDKGFNTPNGAWMFGMTYKSDDYNIILNDGDSSWGSMMCMEINPDGKVSGCGYAANYGQAFFIDRHLYESVPSTDCRKKCYVDFAIDGMSEDDALAALAEYSAHPDWIYGQKNIQQNYGKCGGVELKFRTGGGEVGRNNQYIGFTVAVPMMRVEEMYLIEAEAAGMQEEARGIELLTKFAKLRDPQFVYGQHNDIYGNSKTSAFQNECWWQRRIEFWGEGLATFDIKRLDKGVVRSYAGTNHPDGYRFNAGDYDTNAGCIHPNWMDFCIVQTETNYNYDCTNNPDPIAPKENSAAWNF